MLSEKHRPEDRQKVTDAILNQEVSKGHLNRWHSLPWDRNGAAM